MKQRAAIARTLAVDPKILLMDEPFGALDAQTRSLMQNELLGIWNRSPKTVIFVTHDVQEAVLLAQRVAVMSARPGRIKAIIDTSFDRGDPQLQKTQPFIDRVDEIWELVRAEAIKAQQAKGVVATADPIHKFLPSHIGQLLSDCLKRYCPMPRGLCRIF